MDALPQVGQKYQHKKWGEVEVICVVKLGRGYSVRVTGFGIDPDYQTGEWGHWQAIRLKDFQKATA